MNKVKTEVKHIFGRDQTDVSSGSTSHPDSPTRLTGGTAGNGPTDGRSSMSTEAERIAGRGNPLSGSYGTRGSKSSAETSPKASVAAGSRLSSGSEPYSIEGQPPQPGAPEGSRTGLSPAAGGPRHSTGTESGIGSGATRSSGVGAGVGAGAAGVGSGAAAASAALASRGSTGDIDSDKDRSHTSPVVGAGNLSREGGDGLASAIGNHRHGHGTRHASDINPDEDAEHEHKHLKHVVHDDVRHVNTEEVQRERQHDRHIHHVQHHVQPIKDQDVRPEVIHEKAHPVTHVNETHSSTQHDKATFEGFSKNFKNEISHRPEEHVVVDKGERVNETLHHHVHHVIQPVVEREVHDRHRTHTVIPTKHTTHEAPIIHESTKHEPMHMNDFLGGGGKLDSNLTHSNVGVLNEGDCSKSVDGVGEEIGRKLGLSDVGKYDTAYGGRDETATRGNTTATSGRV